MAVPVRYLFLLLLWVVHLEIAIAFWSSGNHCRILGEKNNRSVVAVAVFRNSRCPKRTSCTSSLLTAAAAAADNDERKLHDDDDDKAVLVLRADYECKSDPVPLITTTSSPTTTTTMIDFFKDLKHRACLVTAGNSRESHFVPTTTELLEKWKDRAALLGATEPVSTDEIISVTVGGINFPGLQVEADSIIGSKLLLPITSDDDNNDETTTTTTPFPSFEFVLIQDKRTTTGLPPIVWVYNQLTGGGKSKDTTPMSLSRVYVCRSSSTQEDDDENTSDITFNIKSFLEIRIKFPAVLLKILPVKKEKAEAQGGEAIAKMLKKDIDISIAKFRDMYLDMVRAT